MLKRKPKKASQEKNYNEINKATLSIFSMVFALTIGAILIEVTGYSALDTYAQVFKGAFGSTSSLLDTISRATPLMLSGLAFIFAARAGVLNIGVEGQVTAGAFTSAIVGAYLVGFHPSITITLAVLAGAAAGGFCALIVAYMKVKFDANEFISSIMLNVVIMNFANYLASGPFLDSDAVLQTRMIQDAARLPVLAPRNQVTIAVFIGVILVIAAYAIFNKTPFGFEMNVLGFNKTAGKFAGVNADRVLIKALVISGMIGGLTGTSIALGSLGRYIAGLSGGIGYEGIAVAALAAGKPLAIIASSVIFGGLKVGALKLNMMTSTPVEYVGVIQFVIVIAVAAPRLALQIIGNIRKISEMVKSKLRLGQER